jgi:hypothetical protein
MEINVIPTWVNSLILFVPELLVLLISWLLWHKTKSVGIYYLVFMPLTILCIFMLPTINISGFIQGFGVCFPAVIWYVTTQEKGDK